MKLIVGFKNIVIKILIKILENRKDQIFWETIYNLSLKSMNYGNGDDYIRSGELYVINFINNNYDNNNKLIVFDVGGNKGNYAKALSDIFKAKAMIYTFEPSAKTYNILLETIKNNKNIIPNNFGFSDSENNQLLYTNEDCSGLASIYNRKLEHYGILMDKSEKIKLLTIDNFCKTNNIDTINFLKLDIEGHELNALIGAKQMISDKQIDYIQFEFGGTNIDSKTYFQDFFYLLKDNYRIYRILKNGLFEISSYNETYEIFVTTNYLAIKKY